MVRRSLWLGLRLGLLVGIAFAVFKTVQSRRTLKEPPTPPPWEPLRPRDEETHEPVSTAPPKTKPEPEPATTPSPSPPSWEEVPTAVAEPDPAPAAGPAFEAPAVPAPGLDVPMAPPEAPAPAAAKKVAKKAAERAVKGAKAAKKVAKRAVKKVAAPVRPWILPEGDVCPQSHPVKAKLASQLFHLPGMLAYDRTRPDRCYADAAAAEADGLKRARR